MKTRCKFAVTKVSQLGYAGMKEPLKQEEITLTAISGTDGENASYAEFTPQGSLTITVTNPAVIGTFKPGSCYYLDLIPTEG